VFVGPRLEGLRSRLVKIALLHSAGAGDAVSPDIIRRAVEGAGHHLVGVFEPDVDLDAVLARSPEVVVAAGGDGMVWRAASAVHGRDIALAIVPLGTANNVATSLGISGSLDELAARWHDAEPRAIDVGVLRGARGETRFLEGVGGGLVAHAIASLSLAPPAPHVDDPDARLAAALDHYRELLAEMVPQRTAMSFDGEWVEGEFLLVEVLNMGSIGPNLVLAPEADPTDGLFDVVMAREQDRAELERYLRHLVEGRAGRATLPTRRARAVSIDGWTQMHLDDEVRLGSSMGTLSIEIEREVLRILV
jgi:diacylglycerol kinase family enzyme